MTQISDKELLKRLKEQRDFLNSEISEYEKGKKHFAYRIATTLRTIFHKNKTSYRILPDLADKYGYLFTLRGRNPPPLKANGFYLGFMLSFRPIDRKEIQNDRTLVSKKFDEYWNEVVYSAPFEQGYTRREIVLIAANKLGGTHVDPVIKPRAENLAKVVLRQSGPNFEDVIVGSVVYEMGVHVLTALDGLIPYLDSKITNEYH